MGPFGAEIHRMSESSTSPITAEENERRDEAALRRGTLGWRSAALSQRSLSIGIGVPREADWVKAAEARGLPIVRRSSGGTGVLHEVGDLVWSIVLPRADLRVGRDYAHAYARFGAGATAFLAELRLRAGWTAAPSLSRSCCTLGARGFVLSVDDRIVGGAAQHLTREGFLHHGTISVTVDRPLVRTLFDLTSAADAHRLVGLRELGIDLGEAELVEHLETGLRAAFA